MTTVGLAIFAVVIILSLFIDLKAHSADEAPSIKNAIIWSIIWVCISVLFALFVGSIKDPTALLGYSISLFNEKTSLFLAGYFLEKSLSVDNLMVFIAVFSYFGISDKYQHRILYFGIIVAIVLRLIFVALGSSLLLVKKSFSELLVVIGNHANVPLAEKVTVICLIIMVLYVLATFVIYRKLEIKFSWLHALFYVCQIGFLAAILFTSVPVRDVAMVAFGAFVLWSAVKMMVMDDEGDEITDYSDKWYVHVTKKMFPVHPQRVGHNFFTRQNGILHITPLFICLVVIEFTDVVFAFDSVPAVISVTQDPFLVYSSNIFAILGLRSMYFMLVAANKYLCKLKYGVIAVLLFIGVKMLLEVAGFHITPNASLIVVFLGIFLSIIASIIWPDEEESGEEVAPTVESNE